VKVIKSEGKAVIYLDEKIDIINSPELKEKLQALYNEGIYVISVDFSITRMIDSSCLGKLLMFQKKLKERNGELKIINVTSDYIKKMFDMIHLDRVINIE